METAENTGYTGIRKTLLDHYERTLIIHYGYVYATHKQCMKVTKHFKIVLIPL